MTDWWPITRSKDDIAVEWSPQGGKVRAKKRSNAKWIHSQRPASKACYAEMIGRDAVWRKEKCK